MITLEQLDKKRVEYKEIFDDCFPNVCCNLTAEEEYAAMDKAIKSGIPYEIKDVSPDDDI